MHTLSPLSHSRTLLSPTLKNALLSSLAPVSFRLSLHSHSYSLLSPSPPASTPRALLPWPTIATHPGQAPSTSPHLGGPGPQQTGVQPQTLEHNKGAWGTQQGGLGPLQPRRTPPPLLGGPALQAPTLTSTDRAPAPSVPQPQPRQQIQARASPLSPTRLAPASSSMEAANRLSSQGPLTPTAPPAARASARP